jgi:hypothetical protein
LNNSVRNSKKQQEHQQHQLLSVGILTGIAKRLEKQAQVLGFIGQSWELALSFRTIERSIVRRSPQGFGSVEMT